MTAQFWVVEAHFSDRLHYWSAGAAGRGHRDGWATDIGFATKLADSESAAQVLVHLCGNIGRVVEHGWISTSEPCLTSDEQKAQAARCACRGADDYCPCQNAPDRTTIEARKADGALERPSRSPGMTKGEPS